MALSPGLQQRGDHLGTAHIDTFENGKKQVHSCSARNPLQAGADLCNSPDLSASHMPSSCS